MFLENFSSIYTEKQCEGTEYFQRYKTPPMSEFKAKIYMDQEEVKLPFDDPEFAAIWEEWLGYRKERKLPKYTPRGLKRTFNMLTRDSGGDAKAAIAMINQSMEQNYQGIFPLKNAQNGPRKGSNAAGKPGTSEGRIARAKGW